jgi:hypothetical protein
VVVDDGYFTFFGHGNESSGPVQTASEIIEVHRSFANPAVVPVGSTPIKYPTERKQLIVLTLEHLPEPTI